MKPSTKAYIFREGGKVASDLLKVVMSRPKKPQAEATEGAEEGTPGKAEALSPTTTEKQPKIEPQTVSPALPTNEQTTKMLKRRLAKELYKAELDLAAKLKIDGLPCDCLIVKHPLALEALAEEVIPKDPDNPVYSEIIQWIGDNESKVSIEGIMSGLYDNEYPKMAAQFNDFRKRVMGTAAFSAIEEPAPPMTLDEAKKLAAEEAAKEVERKWHSQEKK